MRLTLRSPVCLWLMDLDSMLQKSRKNLCISITERITNDKTKKIKSIESKKSSDPWRPTRQLEVVWADHSASCSAQDVLVSTLPEGGKQADGRPTIKDGQAPNSSEQPEKDGESTKTERGSWLLTVGMTAGQVMGIQSPWIFTKIVNSGNFENQDQWFVQKFQWYFHKKCMSRYHHCVQKVVLSF